MVRSPLEYRLDRDGLLIQRASLHRNPLQAAGVEPAELLLAVLTYSSLVYQSFVRNVTIMRQTNHGRPPIKRCAFSYLEL